MEQLREKEKEQGGMVDGVKRRGRETKKEATRNEEAALDENGWGHCA